MRQMVKNKKLGDAGLVSCILIFLDDPRHS